MDKYNRTPHLTWSPGGTNDDKRIVTLDGLLNREIVITEKVDGSNVCLEHDAVYARSHAKAPKHPSFDALKALHAQVKSGIPEGIQIFGEWCYAKHSIEYTRLPSYLLLFGVRHLDLVDGLHSTRITRSWEPWELVEDWAEQLEVATVPLLGRFSVTTENQLKEVTDRFTTAPSVLGGAREGVVVRVASSFGDSEFSTSVAKWVRKDHVSTSDHWSHQEIARNKLADRCSFLEES